MNEIIWRGLEKNKGFNFTTTKIVKKIKALELWNKHILPIYAKKENFQGDQMEVRVSILQGNKFFWR